MAKCIKLQRKHRQPCIGDLDTLIELQDRVITPPTDTVDFSETFTEAATVWAKMDTVRGRTSFDETDVEVDITHEFTVRFLTGITASTWILFEGRRFDILDVEDLEERHEWLVLRCNERGPDSQVVNDA